MIALSICAVTIDLRRITDFLEHHRPAANHPETEWLIFCEESQVAALREKWGAVFPRLHLFADSAIAGLNEKRNTLLNAASGRSAIFLDDDALLEKPETALGLIVAAAAGHEWLLITIRYYSGDQSWWETPSRFRLGKIGSGIEWNQIYRVSVLKEVGGWNPHFGPGKDWPSGEAFLLMFAMHKRGYSPTLLPEVSVRHPDQAVRHDFSDLEKFRRYRSAQGILLLHLSPEMNFGEFAIWLLRFTVWPLFGSVVACLRGDMPLAALRLFSPYDVAKGMKRFFEKPQPVRIQP